MLVAKNGNAQVRQWPGAGCARLVGGQASEFTGVGAILACYRASGD